MVCIKNVSATLNVGKIEESGGGEGMGRDGKVKGRGKLHVFCVPAVFKNKAKHKTYAKLFL